MNSYTELNLNPVTVFIFLALMPFISLAETMVKTEKGHLEGGSFVFDTIVSPSATDVAKGAKVSIVDNRLDGGGADASWLVNGVVSASGDQPRQAVFFTNNNADGGRLLLDLGSIMPVAMINTYSNHEFAGDQGARAPQVYTVYGSRAATPVISDSASDKDWTKIAEVDSRPNKTGQNWGGIHGVSISNTNGDIGEYRYLLWDVKPTHSPLQSKVVWTNTLFTEFDVHTAESMKNDKPAKLAGQNHTVEEVILVFKTHFDIGFTDLASNVVQRYRTSMIDHALDVVDSNKELPTDQQFVWTMPGWPMKKILEDWEGQTPERQRRVMEAFKAGRFVAHALPFTTYTESLDHEDMVRGMSFSYELEQLAGREAPRSAKMTDVPSHSWILPTLLKHAGVDFLHLGCNPASSSPDVPKLFWWEGPDGSRLLTFYSAGNYGEGLLPSKDWPHKTWLAMQMTGDNHGPPSPSHVKNLLKNAKRAGVNARIGRLSDFADAILAEKPELPVIRGDMPDTWTHGLASMPVETKLVRNLRPRILALESLNTLLSFWGAEVSDVSEVIRDAYDNSLRFGEHTWGMNDVWFGQNTFGEDWKKARAEGRYEKFEESWHEKGQHARNIRNGIQPVIEKQLNILAASVNVSGERIVVYNSLPWKRSGLVELRLNSQSPASLKDIATGQIISLSNNPNNGTLSFMASDVPSMGYRSYAFSDKKAGAESFLKTSSLENTIENKYFRVKLDPSKGAISSIINKKNNRELVKDGGQYGFGQYLNEKFSKKQIDAYTHAYLKMKTQWAFDDMGREALPADVPYKATRTHDMSLNITKNSQSVVAKMSSPKSDLYQGVSLEVTLYSDQPHIDITWSIDKKTEDPWPEADWLTLSFNIDNPEFKLWRLGGVMNPAKDIVRSTNHSLFCLYGGMAVLGEDGSGVGICPMDSPLVSLGKPGLWNYKREFVPAKANVFVNLYNNMWDTNFQEWTNASWSSTVRIWAIDKYKVEPDLITSSSEVRAPLLAGFAKTGDGKLPVVNAGLELSRKGVLVTAFGKNPFGGGTILRFWEQSGVGGKCKMVLDGEIKYTEAQFCNLRSDETQSINSSAEGELNIDLSANAPLSILLK